MDEYLIGSRLVHFAAVMLLFGASSFRLYAGTESWKRKRVRADFDRWLRNVLLAAACAAFLSAIAWWDALAVSVGDGWADALNWEVLAAVLLQTWFGEIWIWRLAGLAITIFFLLLSYRYDWSSGADLFVAVLAMASLASLAGVGHAAIDVSRQVNQTVHLIAAGTWIGGLAPLGYLLGRAVSAGDAWKEAACHALPRFSRVAYIAVSLVLLSALWIGWEMTGGFSELSTSNYGRVVIAKICLFMLLMTIAAINRLYWMPKIIAVQKRKTWAVPLLSLQRSVLFEQVVAVAILLVASILGTLQP